MEYPHSKRFVYVFQLHSCKESGYIFLKKGWEEIFEFDTLAEAREVSNMYEKYYKNDEIRKYGAILIDYEKQIIVQWFGDKTIYYSDNRNKIKAAITTSSKMTSYSSRYLSKELANLNGISDRSYEHLCNMDALFRKPNEIPEDYKWDIGEYEGWLRFRWGDGKNAI